MVIATKQRVQVIVEMLTKNAKGFNKAMHASTEQMKDVNLRGNVMNRSLIGANTSFGRLGLRVRKAAHGMRGFRMEMLGIMFAGMFLQRVLTGLLRTSLEWTGVTEVLSLALGLLFLPVALMLLDWALKFLDIVMALSPAQKLWIGKIVLLGLAIGALLFLLGSFTLAIGSLLMAVGSFLIPLGLLLAALAAIAAVVIGGAMFDGLIEKTEKLGDSTEDLQIVTNGLDFSGIKTKLSVGITKAVDFLGEKLPIWTEKGLEIASTILAAIEENWDKISATMDKLITLLADWVNEHGAELAKIGADIAWSIIKGFGEVF